MTTASRFLLRARHMPKVAVGLTYEAHEAGDSAFDKGFGRLLIPMGFVFFAMIAAGFAFGKGGVVALVVDGGVAVAMLAAVVIDRAYSSEAWLKGWFGECMVAYLLTNLPETFTVLHDVTVDGKKWNIDHIIVGPTGVWLIETKNWGGKITLRGTDLTLNGYDQSRHVQRTKANAASLFHELHRHGIDVPWVHAVMVSVRSRVPDGVIRLPQAVVVGSSDVVPHIRRGKHVLRAETVAAVVGLIEGAKQG